MKGHNFIVSGKVTGNGFIISGKWQMIYCKAEAEGDRV